MIKHFDTKQNSGNKEVNLVQNEEARSEIGQSPNPVSEITGSNSVYPSLIPKHLTFFWNIPHMPQLFIYDLCLIIIFDAILYMMSYTENKD